MKRPLLFALLLVAPLLHAQSTASLNLGNGSGQPGSLVTLNMNLGGGTNPAGVQWTMTYPAAAVAYETAAVGASAPTKNVTCSGTTGSTTCIVFGLNADTMLNGTVAVLGFRIKAGASPDSVNVQVSNTSATTPEGTGINATGSNGSITVTEPGLSRSVLLSWADTINPPTTTYNAYRAAKTCSTAAAGDFAKINAQPITQKTFTDPSIPPGIFCYQVTAEASGLESDPSNSAEGQVRPAMPSSLTVVVEVAIRVKPDGEVVARMDVKKSEPGGDNAQPHAISSYPD
jgi:hypothetical protein